MKTLKFILIIAFGILFINGVNAYYNIENYKIKGQILEDGTINVNEKINANFNTEMHGIERIFDRYYTVENTEFQVFYNNINISGDNYTTYTEYGNTVARIGDKDRTIFGDHEYHINYSMYGVIKSFSGMGYSELYRNIIGYNWDTNINNSEIEIELPKLYTGLKKEDFLISVGITPYYNIEDFPGIISWNEKSIHIIYTGELNPYNGITLAVKFPSNYFEFDHEKQASLFVDYLRDFIVENNNIFGVVQKDGTINFKNTIQLKKYKPINYLRGNIPFKFYKGYEPNWTYLSGININGKDFEYEEYNTTNKNQYFNLIEFSGNNELNSEYTLYGLIKPYTGEDETWKYKIELPLPIFELNEFSEDIKLELEFPDVLFPNVCSGIYREDIEIQEGGFDYGIDGFYNAGGNLWCENNILYFNPNKIINTDNINLTIKLGDLGFNLNEKLLTALDTIGNGEDYYDNELNWQSLVYIIIMLLGCGGFISFIKKRYKTEGKKKMEYIVEYDAPKGMDSPEAGAIIDDYIDSKDITALIYQRASNQYIEILKGKKNKEKYYIKKLRNLPKGTKIYQSELFDNLFKNSNEFHFFDIKNDKKSNEFKKYIKNAKKGLKDYIDENNWYTKDFDNIKTEKKSFKSANKNFVFRSTLIWIVAYYSAVSLINSFLIPVRSGIKILGLIGAIIIATSYRGKEKELNTDLGNKLLKHCLGYKKFLMKVDKDKFERLTKEDPLFIERALPYAVVFGIDNDFIKKITPENISWFKGDINDLAESISYFNKAITYYPTYYTSYSNYSSTDSGSYRSYSSYSPSSGHSSGSSFSGGYSSGGGGGGGGGRGW